MSRFFERNKRKGLVGLLYLFYEKKKVAVLVLVAVAGALGIVATTLVKNDARLPAPVRRVLKAVHLGPPDGAGPGRAAFSSKARQEAVSRIALSGSAAGSRSGASSMDMVQGGNNVLQAKTPTAERLGGKTVRAVGRPLNARGEPPPIPLSETEMKSGLARGDAAAVVRAGELGEAEGAGGGSGAGPGGGKAEEAGASASRMLMAGGDMGGARAVNSGPGGLVQRMTEARNRSLGGSSGGGGGQLGRLSAFSQEKGVRIINAWNAGAGPGCDQTDNALCELVVARAGSKAGAKNMESCPSCPKETGTHMAATSFDGKSRRQSGVVTSSDEAPPEVDGSYVDSLIKDGEQLYDKINNCDDAMSSFVQKLNNLSGAVSQTGARVREDYRIVKGYSDRSDQWCQSFYACMADCSTLCSLACGGFLLTASTYGSMAYFYQQKFLRPSYEEYKNACDIYNLAREQETCKDMSLTRFQCGGEDEFEDVKQIRHWQMVCGG